MKKKYIIAGTVVVILAIMATCIFNSLQRTHALKNSVIVVGEIQQFDPSRGAKTIKVRYEYRGRTIYNTFSTYDPDSLKIKTKILIKVSTEYPEKYIEYIGIYH